MLFKKQDIKKNEIFPNCNSQLCILLSVEIFRNIALSIKVGCCGTFTCLYYSNVFRSTTPRGVSSRHWLGHYIFSPCLYSCTFCTCEDPLPLVVSSVKIQVSVKINCQGVKGEIYKISRLSDPQRKQVSSIQAHSNLVLSLLSPFIHLFLFQSFFICFTFKAHCYYLLYSFHCSPNSNFIIFIDFYRPRIL